jgi:hypothetical protein
VQPQDMLCVRANLFNDLSSTESLNMPFMFSNSWSVPHASRLLWRTSLGAASQPKQTPRKPRLRLGFRCGYLSPNFFFASLIAFR